MNAMKAALIIGLAGVIVVLLAIALGAVFCGDLLIDMMMAG